MDKRGTPQPTADRLPCGAVPAHSRHWLDGSGLRPLTLAGRTLLPIVQGGMGVGISAGGLAGTVAAAGAVGTIASVDLRRLHPDLMERTAHLDKSPAARACIDAANDEALDREIRRARALAGGYGMIAVNVMRALSAYERYVRQALVSGADAIVVGAGLPLDLPDLARDYPHVALIPILSDARGVQVVVRRWMKRGRLPDAIILEHPRLAGGHLGAARVADVHDRRFDFDVAVPEVRDFLIREGVEREIPVIVAGGISSHAEVQRLQALGAAAVQLGTAFAVTAEADAAEAFKRVLAQARPEDLVEFISVAGLPARAVRTPWLEKYLRLEPRMQSMAHPKRRCNMGFDCLTRCGLRDGVAEMGQFCIDQQLGHALAGDVQRGLFFRGAGRLPFGDAIRPVQDLLRWLLGQHVTAAAPA
ncbi:MAG: NAD(P)H-dependent flavin oxidoreductase [Tepidimonas sp.]|uniref:NAD(P)H-dependent flavin oxidoreductase n=1 Tax=Tepidimonas sp. TaxID=2002775 RepID=UPI004054D721